MTLLMFTNSGSQSVVPRPAASASAGNLFVRNTNSQVTPQKLNQKFQEWESTSLFEQSLQGPDARWALTCKVLSRQQILRAHELDNIESCAAESLNKQYIEDVKSSFFSLLPLLQKWWNFNIFLFSPKSILAHESYSLTPQALLKRQGWTILGCGNTRDSNINTSFPKMTRRLWASFKYFKNTNLRVQDFLSLHYWS